MEESNKVYYPFSAVVGQDDLKQCLILCAIDPTIGGVLIKGDKGTAKSTAARGLARVLPPIEVSYDQQSKSFDPYNRGALNGDEEVREIPTPFVDLPIGATEDRVLGSIDFSATLKQGGERIFAPGLLAAANRGILYIDEVNLLPAHLVDVLLDAAAMGINTIQREGMTMTHPAEFMLIGTMNPEEGDLRPQLLDRFGLMVVVVAPREVRLRAEVVRQRITFDRNPASFKAQWEANERLLTQRIQVAKERLSQVNLPDDLLFLISRICTEFKVDSLRADITLYKAATALAAWEGRTTVEAKDIGKVAEWVLTHRRRRQPFDSPSLDEQDTNQLLEQLVNTPPEDHHEPEGHQQGPAGSTSAHEPSSSTRNDDDNNMQTFTASKPGQIKQLKLDKKTQGQPGTGRRSLLMDVPQRGRHIRSVQTDKPVDLALDATLRAAAANGLDADTGQPIIQSDNWQRKVRQSTTDTLILFVVDASGSMAARQRMEAVKGAVLALLTDAYQQRDRVGVISFRGLKAEVLLQPTRSVELAEQHLQRLPTGGRTPLAHALSLTYETAHRLRQNEPEQAILLILLSDGKANVPLPDSPQGDDSWIQTQQVAAKLAALAIPTLMLDTETGHVRVGRGQELAKLLKADYLELDDFGADNLVHTIRQVVG
mmetsp:Transcript_1851/g.4902  ORF Transcript_1851/g.4902 Transcript_1851/m.4902 type:complete len:655 (-) Transcript_1851:59-2023(-)